jgi:SRSO17 transposase
MAARLNPTNLRQTHQSLHHFISTSAWSDQAVLTRVDELAIPVLQEQEPIRAWIVDDSAS